MTMLIPHKDLATLLFGQQHILTQRFFCERFGQSHTIPLEEFPHYEFLACHLRDPFGDHDYAQYLACSWEYYFGKQGNTPEKRRKRIEKYLHLYREIEGKRQLGAGAIEKPINICRRPDGRLLIVNGNHRAAIALKLDLDVSAVCIPPAEYLAKTVLVPHEFYGTQRLDRPYQSIFWQGQELISGRRTDIHHRMQQLVLADLHGRSVLDLGCNIGMNCYLAAERGAVRAVGVEASPKIASAAVRLNAFFAQACSFVLHDLNDPLDLGRFDTVLCFSLAAHVRKKENLVATIRRHVGQVLYFEGHAGTTEESHALLVNQNMFSKIDLIGFGQDGIHTDTWTRPLFRCEVCNNVGRLSSSLEHR